MANMKLTLIPLILLIGITSCFRQQYPSNWASIDIPVTGCPNLSGVYYDLSSEAPGTNSSSARLTEILLDMKRAEDKYYSIATHVEILQKDDDSFEVCAWDGDQVLKRIVFYKNKNDFECSGGMIHIGSKGDAFYEQGGYGVGMSCFYFAKASDGSLVLLEKSFGAGFYCILPIVAGGTTWYIFDQH